MQTNRLTAKPTHEVISAIQALDLESVKSRLMDEEIGEGWTPEYADSIELAYKRYLTMLAKYPEHAEEIMLAKDVDEFWHMHILHTMKYAEDCQNVFGTFLHHSPHVRTNTAAEVQQRAALAEKTRLLYQQEFGLAGESAQIAPVDQKAYCGAALNAKTGSYCGAAGMAQEAAYCGVAKLAYCGAASIEKEAAYCGAAVDAHDASYCGAAVTQKLSYCGAAVDGDAAYCGATIENKAAYCGATIAPSNAAYCGAAVTTVDSAYCGATIREKTAAYCGVADEVFDAAYCGAAIGGKGAAYCGATVTDKKPVGLR